VFDCWVRGLKLVGQKKRGFLLPRIFFAVLSFVPSLATFVSCSHIATRPFSEKPSSGVSASSQGGLVQKPGSADGAGVSQKAESVAGKDEGGNLVSPILHQEVSGVLPHEVAVKDGSNSELQKSVPAQDRGKPGGVILVLPFAQIDAFYAVGVLKALAAESVPIHAIVAQDLSAIFAALYLTQKNVNRFDWSIAGLMSKLSRSGTMREFLAGVPGVGKSFDSLGRSEGYVGDYLRDVFLQSGPLKELLVFFTSQETWQHASGSDLEPRLLANLLNEQFVVHKLASESACLEQAHLLSLAAPQDVVVFLTRQKVPSPSLVSPEAAAVLDYGLSLSVFGGIPSAGHASFQSGQSGESVGYEKRNELSFYGKKVTQQNMVRLKQLLAEKIIHAHDPSTAETLQSTPSDSAPAGSVSHPSESEGFGESVQPQTRQL
jgi:hypothetical protein